MKIRFGHLFFNCFTSNLRLRTDARSEHQISVSLTTDVEISFIKPPGTLPLAALLQRQRNEISATVHRKMTELDVMSVHYTLPYVSL